MLRILSLGLYALAAFGTISALPAPYHAENKRTITAIQNDFVTIANKIANIQTTAILLPSSGAVPAQVQAVITTIKATSTAAQQGTSDTNLTPAFTDAQATQLITAFNTLIPNQLQTALGYVDAKKSVFSTLGYTLLCYNAMVSLKTDFHAFTGALISKSPTAEVAAATAMQANVDTIIQNAINAFI